MTPREIIKRNLDFTGPARIGLAFDRDRTYDFRFAGIGPSVIWQKRTWTEGNIEYYDDEWGNIWHRVAGDTGKGEVFKPAIREWPELENLRFPDFAGPERFSTVKQVFETDKELYRLGVLPGFPFSICRCLRGMETYFQDLLLERSRVDELHARVTSLLTGVIKEFAGTGADGIIFGEDWGTQERLLVSPAMWREIFKPLFEQLCGAAHALGLHVIMHSCGYNWEILGDLAEAGVDCFQFDQPRLYGLERLSRKLKELKVCLFSPVDIQKVLPTGDRGLIAGEARKMAELFGRRNGGLIAKSYGDLKSIGVDPEWDNWAYKAFLECCHCPLMAD